MEWIKCSDRLPAYNEKIISAAYIEEENDYEILMVELCHDYDYESIWWKISEYPDTATSPIKMIKGECPCEKFDCDTWEITHWMNLPSFPKD